MLQVAHWSKGAADQAPAAPGFTASREKVGFQTWTEIAHANFSSITATFALWRALGKHPCQKGNSPMQLIFSVLLHPTLHFNHVH